MTEINDMAPAETSCLGSGCGASPAKPTTGEQQKHQMQDPFLLDLQEQAMKEVEKRWFLSNMVYRTLTVPSWQESENKIAAVYFTKPPANSTSKVVSAYIAQVDPKPTHSSAVRMGLQRGVIPLPPGAVALMWTQHFHKILIRKVTAEQFEQLELGSFDVPEDYHSAPDPKSSSSAQHGRANSSGQHGGSRSSGSPAEIAAYAVAKAKHMQAHLRNLMQEDAEAVAAGQMEHSAELRTAIESTRREAAQATAMANFAVARRDTGGRARLEAVEKAKKEAREIRRKEEARQAMEAELRRAEEEAQSRADEENQHSAKAAAQALQAETAAQRSCQPSCKDRSSHCSSSSAQESCSLEHGKGVADSRTLQDSNNSKQGPGEAAKGKEHTHNSSDLQDSSDDGVDMNDQVSSPTPSKPAAPESPYSCWGQVFPEIAAAEDAAAEARMVAEVASAAARKALDARKAAEEAATAAADLVKALKAAVPKEPKPKSETSRLQELHKAESSTTAAASATTALVHSKQLQEVPKAESSPTAAAAASATTAVASSTLSVTAQRRKDILKEKEEAAQHAAKVTEAKVRLAEATVALAAADAAAAPLAANAVATRAAAAAAQRAVYCMQAAAASEMHSSAEVERLRACNKGPAWLNPALRFPPVLMSAEHQTPESEALNRHLGLVSWKEPEQYRRVDFMYEGVPSELWCPRQYIQGSSRDVGTEVRDAPRKRHGVLGRARTAVTGSLEYGVLEGRDAVVEGLIQKSWLEYCPAPPPRKQSALMAFYNARIRPTVDRMKLCLRHRVDDVAENVEEVGQRVGAKVAGLLDSASQSMSADQTASGAAAAQGLLHYHPGKSSGRHGEMSAAAVAAAAIAGSHGYVLATRSHSITGSPGSAAKNSGHAVAAGRSGVGAHGSGCVQGNGGGSDAMWLAARGLADQPAGSPSLDYPQLDLSIRAGR